jgi:hypothetical protein
LKLASREEDVFCDETHRYVEHCGFAGAFAVTQCVDFAAPEFQAVLNESMHAREILLYPSNGESWGSHPRLLSASHYKILRPDDHLPNTVAILAGYCEGLIDAFDLPGVCKQRSKPPGVRVEQFQSLFGLVVRSAHGFRSTSMMWAQF